MVEAYNFIWRLAFGNVVNGSFKQYCLPPKMVRFKYSACGIGSVSMLNLWREMDKATIDWMIEIMAQKAYTSAEYLHFLILRTKFFEESKESFGTEIPLACGKKLQNIQTITDTSLHATHAEI